MNEKSVRPGSFYVPTGTDDTGGEGFDSLPSTAGPWSADAQHGGPPAALLARAIEGLPETRDAVIGRIGMDLWGPVPVGPLRTTATVLRPGRNVVLAAAGLYDAAGDRLVAEARAWLFPRSDDGPATGAAPLAHTPAEGAVHPRPEGWSAGYLDAIEWRWVRGGLEQPGAGTVWMRSPDLVAGEPISPVQRLMACVDSASGASAALDVRDWTFLNTELTVHVLRPPVGEWLCLDAETTLGTGAVGVCTAAVHDSRGLVARSAQALLVRPR